MIRFSKQGGARRRLGYAPVGLAIVALVLAGCGSSSSSSSSTSSSSASSSSGSGGSSKPVKLALVELLTANAFYQALAAGATSQAHAVPGVSLTVTGPPAPNPTTEISDITQVLSQGVDGVIVDPIAAGLFTKPLGTAAAQTRVVTVDNPGIQGTPGNGTFVGNNQYESSAAMLDAVFSRLPTNTTGTIVLGICIPGIAALEARVAAYKAYIAKKLPHVKVVGPFTTTTDPTGNLSNWQRIYGSNPGALAYLGNCDSDGPSLVRVHQLHPGNYQTATFDIDAATLQGIKNGAMTAAVNEQPFVRGAVSTGLLIDAAKAGKPVLKGWVNVKGQIVTKSNIDAVIANEASPATGYAPEIQTFLKNPATATGPIVLQPIGNAYKTS